MPTATVMVLRAADAPVRLTLPYPPTVNMYWRHSGNRTYISHEGRAYKERVADRAREQGAEPLVVPVMLAARIYRPRRSGDLDNVFKALLDGLKTVAYTDDKQVKRFLDVELLDDKQDPRVEVALWGHAPIPVWVEW